MNAERFIIGKITKPHGIHGEVRVRIETDFPDRFLEMEMVYLVSPTEDHVHIVRIEFAREHGTVFLIKFLGIDTRNQAENLRNYTLEITRDQLMELPEGVHYIFDLIGSEVITDDGVLLGRVFDVLQLSSNDVYVVRNDKHQEILIPVIHDVVKDINIETKKIMVTPLDGLLEIYQQK